ncbi:hypothetical protein [Haloechinothrix salitolerans]|uniref:Uncharacterized protein n=1 Tax=Haloechinothrix salitolerans TaxID=926830 RepID=A0ABW2BW71_9PSEU
MVKLAKLAAIGVFAAVLALFGGTLSAAAASVTPTVLSGNPDCTGDLKIEPVESGTYGPVTITVHGSSFDFSSTVLVTDVIVKGGPDANWYDYGDGVFSDTDLTAPINAKNGKPYGLSHLCFSLGDDKKDPDPKK